MHHNNHKGPNSAVTDGGADMKSLASGETLGLQTGKDLGIGARTTGSTHVLQTGNKDLRRGPHAGHVVQQTGNKDWRRGPQAAHTSSKLVRIWGEDLRQHSSSKLVIGIWGEDLRQHTRPPNW